MLTTAELIEMFPEELSATRVSRFRNRGWIDATRLKGGSYVHPDWTPSMIRLILDTQPGTAEGGKTLWGPLHEMYVQVKRLVRDDPRRVWFIRRPLMQEWEAINSDEPERVIAAAMGAATSCPVVKLSAST